MRRPSASNVRAIWKLLTGQNYEPPTPEQVSRRAQPIPVPSNVDLHARRRRDRIARVSGATGRAPRVFSPEGTSARSLIRRSLRHAAGNGEEEAWLTAFMNELGLQRMPHGFHDGFLAHFIKLGPSVLRNEAANSGGL